MEIKNFIKIYDEVLRNVDSGVKEIYLLGQNVNAYHFEHSEVPNKESHSKTKFDLADLIKEIANINVVNSISSLSKLNFLDKKIDYEEFIKPYNWTKK